MAVNPTPPMPTLDPNQPKMVIREGWIERIRDPQDKVSTLDNTYAYERLYADGTYVLEFFRRGEDGVKRTETIVNTDQQRAWADATKAAERADDKSKPPGGIPTKVINGQVFGWNPDTRAYDIPTGQEPATGAGNTPARPAGGSENVEGTPDPSKPGGFDNERPRRVIRDAQGQEVWSEPLTGQALKDWQEAREKSRNPDNLTDAQVAARQKEQQAQQQAMQPGRKTQPVADHPGWTMVTEVNPANNTQDTYYLDPNGQRAALPQKPDKAEVPKRQAVTRNGKTYFQVANPDGTMYFEDQQGNRVELPDEVKDGSYQALPNGVPKFTPDLTKFDLGLSERKRTLDALVNQGVITAAQAAQTIQMDHETAQAAGKNAGAIVNIQEGNRSAALTARGQDASVMNARTSFAGSTFNQVMSTLGPIAAQFIPGPGAAEAAAAGFMAMLGVAREHAAKSGGLGQLSTYNLSDYPILNQLGSAGIPGLPGGPPLSDGWTFPGMPGAGGPSGPAMPTPPTPMTEAAPATPRTLPPPIFTPQPPVVQQQAPAAPTISINLGGPPQQQPPAGGQALAVPMLGPGSQIMRAAAMAPGPQFDPNSDGLLDDMRQAGFDDDVLGSVFGGMPRLG